MTIMIDAIGSKVPRIIAEYGRVHPVQAYLAQPGMYPYIPWTAAQVAEFPMGHIMTATMGGRPEDARHARELDRETGDAGDQDVAPHLIARHDFRHDDGQIYCNMSSLEGVLAAIQNAGIWAEPWWRLRVAWWWGNAGAPTLSQVINEAAAYLAGTDLMPAASRFWGCQYHSGDVDLTKVYGVPDFTR
jgi:hypothetical protein